MESASINDLSKLYDEKFKKKQMSIRRPISHIEAFYGQQNASSGLLDFQSRGAVGSFGHMHRKETGSLNDLNILL